MWQFGAEITASALCHSRLCLLIPSVFRVWLHVCLCVCARVCVCIFVLGFALTLLLVSREPVWVEFSNLPYRLNEAQLRLCCSHRLSCSFCILPFVIRTDCHLLFGKQELGEVIVWLVLGLSGVIFKETSMACSFFYLIIQTQRPTRRWRVRRGADKNNSSEADAPRQQHCSSSVDTLIKY